MTQKQFSAYFGIPTRTIEENGLDKTLSTYSEDSKKEKEYLLSDKWMDYYGEINEGKGLRILQPLLAEVKLSYAQSDLFR